MISYANTSMYQPGLNYNSYGNGLSTGFSMSNYTDTTSVFQGSNMNTGYYSQQCMAPQQQNNNEAFMQQLVLLLISNLLQRRQAETTTTTEETIIDTDNNHAHDKTETKKIEIAKHKMSKDEKIVAAHGVTAAAVFGGW